MGLLKNKEEKMATSSSVDLSLPFILDQLIPPPDWYDLGTKLKVDQNTLERVAVAHLAEDSGKCLHEVLDKWLEKENSSDKMAVLANALRDIDRLDLSEKFEENELMKDQSKNEVDKLPVISDESTSSVQQAKDIKAAIEHTEDSRLRTKSEEADSDYVTSIVGEHRLSSSSSMDSINRSLIVLKECAELQYKFKGLMSEVQSQLSIISLAKIRRFVAQEIKGFTYRKKPSSIEQVMLSAHNYFYYLNYTLIETIAYNFLPNSNLLAKKFQEYQEAVKYFANIAKVQDLSQCDETMIYSYAGMELVCITLSSSWLNMSLEDLQKLAQICFTEDAKSLTHLRVNGEALQVTWLAPKIFNNLLIARSKIQEKFLKQVGVLGLTIGQEVILQQPALEITQKVLSNALLAASVEGNTNKASLLISLGADPNSFGETGVTPLMLASKQARLKTVELLLKANANVNQLNENGNSALMAAATSGNEEVIKLLLAYNADPHVRGTNKHSALSVASLRGHREAVSLLLWIDANPNIQTENGWTPLMYAATRGDIAMAKMLLKCGAEINTARNDGKTAITEATENGHTDIVRLIKAFKILKNKTDSFAILQESPSPGTLHRRRSVPLSLNLTPTIEHRSRRGSGTSNTSMGIPSFHSTNVYPVSQQQAVPRSIFRPITKRGATLYSINTKLTKK